MSGPETMEQHQERLYTKKERFLFSKEALFC